jgi:hypothetical protein
MAPLHTLTERSKGSIEWTPSFENIRQKILACLTDSPILMIFDPNCPIELYTDASAIGYGAILMQRKNGKAHVIAYFSKRTTPAESKYHSYELETLAVVNAVRHFRHYLYGRQFTVFTDCNSLQSTRKKLDLTPRVHRWWAFLQAFDFDIVHIDGKRMAHADFLSRNPLRVQPGSSSSIQNVERQNSCSLINNTECKRVEVTNISCEWLSAEQQKDNEIKKLLQDLSENILDSELAKTYEIRLGVLYRKIQRNGKTRCLPILPRALRWSVISSTHEAIMHLGWDKTLEKLYDMYWFENMSKYVRKFVENCVTCRISKSQSGKVQVELHPIPKVPVPWHTVHVDATGKLSGKNDRKEYAFVLIDAFTKFVLLYHSTNIDAASSIRAVDRAVSIFGAPTRIIADQGRCFASASFREYCQFNNISLHLIATGSARANGQVERVMGTLKNMLTVAESDGDKSWQDSLPQVQLALNSTINRVTKSSPLELMIGKVARPLNLMFADCTEPEVDLGTVRALAVENIKKSASYEKARFDCDKAKLKKFALGDFVLLKNEERNQTKLDPKYRGPFKIVEILDGDRYLMKGLTGNRTYKYAHDRLRAMPENQISDNEDLESSDGSS